MNDFVDIKTAAKLLAEVPEHKRQQAYKKLGILEEAKRFAAEFVRNGGDYKLALEVYVSQNQTSKRSIERWMAICRREGILGLVDKRGGGNSSAKR